MVETAVAFITSYLAANQVASGGAVLMVLGATLAYLRLLPGYIWMILRRWFVYTIEVSSSDLVYTGVTAWLSANDVASKCHSFKAMTIRFQQNNWYSTKQTNKNSSLVKEQVTKKLGMLLKPLNEFRWFWKDGSLVFFYTYREKFEQSNGSGNDRTEDGTQVSQAGEMYYETYVFSSWFKTGRKAITNILKESIKGISESVDDRLEIKLLKSQFGSASWESLDTKPKRFMDSVALHKDQKDDILADARLFFDSKAWYESVGLPWRRGYLLYGPPGNGKSTLVTALASELDRPIYIMNVSDLKSDLAAMDAFNSVPEGSIILLEEIDTAFDTDRKRSGGAPSDFSFSGLLNSLDGVAGQVGSIIIMTTNHVDKLDKALIRPGRSDKKILFSNCSKEQLKIMIHKFIPDIEDAILADVLDKYKPESLSVAQVQEALLSGDPYKVLEEPRVESTSEPIKVNLDLPKRNKKKGR